MQWLGHPCLHNQSLETGTSPVVQWLSLCASNARDLVRFLVRELRFHMLCGKAKYMFVYNFKIIFFNAQFLVFSSYNIKLYDYYHTQDIE